jgi:hypothetical protein
MTFSQRIFAALAGGVVEAAAEFDAEHGFFGVSGNSAARDKTQGEQQMA